MIDLIKAILELAGQLIPVGDILKQRRANEVAELGLQLFDLYNSVIDVSQNGYVILERVRQAVDQHNYYYKSNVPDGAIRAVEALRAALDIQSEALSRLLDSFKTLRPIAEIAESSSAQSTYLSLYNMLTMKAGIVGRFAGLYDIILDGEFGYEGIWLAVEFREANRLIVADKIQMESVASTPIYFSTTKSPENIEERIYEMMQEKVFDIGKIPWSENVNRVAELYSNSGFGEKRLKILVDSASQFRANFQKNFKIEDVLLAAEQRLMATRGSP